MSHCDRTIGRRLIDGELSSAEETAALNHLDECPQCQEWLEQEAGDDAAWTATRSFLSSSVEVACWPRTHADLAALTQSHLRRTAGVDDEAARHPAVDVSFLAPTDDPAYLGRVGAYEIAGVIGHGGMGVVLKAVDRSLSRYVAIKVLSPALSQNGAARQRFAREARAMAALSHEHVVPIYAVDEHRGLPYFAMEYVPGGTLQARLSREGPLEVVAAVRIANQTALALQAAHDSGLVHRDIKPANILLDRGVERVRVADFGLARTASEASYTASGVLAGTPQFMSPEQVRGEPCDGRSDLFSLGSVLYAMCTGHEPFRAESVYGVLQRIVTDAPRPISEQNPAVPAWLERFVGKLMAKDRADRFQSAAEVAELLERELAYLQSPSIGPAPSRPWMHRKMWRWSAWTGKQQRAAVIAATLLALTATVSMRRWGDVASDESRPDEQVAAQEAAPHASSSVQRPTATMWDADGAAEASALADALEASPYGAATAAPPDPWPAAVDELRQRMIELTQELSPTTFPRNEP